MEKKELFDKQLELNGKLSVILRNDGIKNLCITSYGNSIASGYSMMRTIKPLLLRNETINSVMNHNDIHLERHAFARAQNNSDEHLFEWLVTNTKESEINEMNRSDYDGGVTSMPISSLDYSKLDDFYPIDIPNDKGLRDIVESKGIDLANIIIYNGCTGSFLDNITRGGKLSQMLTYGINRDVTGLEAILKYIQSNNRKNGTNTQVYICGAPNFLGLNISGVINRKLKSVSEKYANTTYVEPVKSKFFYKNISTGKLGVDIHYDELEYDKLNNNILKSIIENYKLNKTMIDTDRKLCDMSSILELKTKDVVGNDAAIKDLLEFFIEDSGYEFDTDNEVLNYYKRCLKYLTEREPYDYFYLGKKNIKEVTNEAIKKQKTLIKK